MAEVDTCWDGQQHYTLRASGLGRGQSPGQLCRLSPMDVPSVGGVFEHACVEHLALQDVLKDEVTAPWNA